jgi:hypothetical protein
MILEPLESPADMPGWLAEHPAETALAHLRIIGDAVISTDKLYRYWLTRVWDGTKFLLPIVGLNPSTADALVDDPTIRRDMAFAQREDAGGIIKANLYGFRATKPEDMLRARDPYGPENATYLMKLIDYAAAKGVPIFCAWGVGGGWTSAPQAFVQTAQSRGATLICLGTTKDGHPKHPLYVKGDTPWQLYPPEV